MLSEEWSPDSWRSKPIRQCPPYPPTTASRLEPSVAQLRRLPPLVHPREIAQLRHQLREVARGRAFLLQGGDCAELFSYCEQGRIESKIKLLLQMSLVLVWGADKPVVRIGRMAGQYAKPRSSDREMVDGRSVPSFRGDILNGFASDDRDLDPTRLVSAYHHSAATLNYVRAAIASGIADLHRPLDWGLGHVRDEKLRAKYSEAALAITDMLRFLRTIGADKSHKLDTVDLYTSHEGLLLEYEQALTRLVEGMPVEADEYKDSSSSSSSSSGGGEQTNSQRPSAESSAESSSAKQPTRTAVYYDTSAHFLWIGDRTRQVNGAHVEFFRGIANPVGVKVGPTTTTSDLLALLRVLNPSASPGKVTLITRYGASRVRHLLPAHIRVVEDSEFRRAVVWQCDPMHGNTLSTGAGIKTRHFRDIFDELSETLRIHKEQGSCLGGVHLELTGEAVTECLGGGEDLGESDLETNYTTYCDPRLNEKQALELAFLIADHYRNERRPNSVK